jgi:site-specific DNA-cytosine methylase
MNLMIDLFSGLGGASSAFIKDSEWSVLRYESNPLLEHVPCTILCDLKTYEIHCRHEVDLVWASPPCNEFSLGFHAPRSKAIRAGEDYEPDLSLIFRAKEIIDALNPRYWVNSLQIRRRPPTNLFTPYFLYPIPTP